MIQVHITDDEKMLVELLCPLVDNSGFATVMGTSHSLAQSRDALAMKRPDIFLLDINLPDGNGIDFCAEALELYPGLKILVLTRNDDVPNIARAFENGALGYILKNERTADLLEGILCAMEGKRFMSLPVEKKMAKHTGKDPLRLTPREREVMDLVKDHYSNKDIARRMDIAPGTVKVLRKHLYRKLDVHSVRELRGKAFENSQGPAEMW